MSIIIAILAFFSLGLFFYAIYPFIEGRLQNWQRRRIDKIAPQLDRMFLRIPYRRLLVMDIACTSIIGYMAFYITKNPYLAAASAFLGLAILNFILRQMEVARKNKFTSQLVDGLMILSGSLKAGLSLIQSIEALVEEMPPPISQEFGLVVTENRMGVPLEECLIKLKRRMQSEELDMIITTIMVGMDTGGELTTVFSNLVLVIRERNRLFSRVKALCVQGKLQGRIMMFLPVLFGFAAYKINPGFFSVLMNDASGRLLVGYAVISEIIGIILIMRLSRIEV